MLEFFTRKRPTVQEIGPDIFMGKNGPSIFFVGRLEVFWRSPDELNSLPYFRANIDELGFGESWLSRFSSEPPRAPQGSSLDGSVEFLDVWCQDRFFFAQSGKSRRNSLASVDIKEKKVYDHRMRGDIDYTGFMVSVTLSEEAFRPFLKYVGALASLEDFRGPMFAVRMPSRPFTFPDLRRIPNPWAYAGTSINDLKVIRRFKVDEFSVAIVEYKIPYIKWSPGSTIYERYNVLSAKNFFMVRN